MFQLLCKDDLRAEFNLSKVETEVFVTDLKIYGTLPTGVTEDTFTDFILSRNAAKHRVHLSKYLESMNCKDIIGFLRLTHGVSINDCYWVKENFENLQWSRVSLYDNPFDTVTQRLAFDGAGMFGAQISSTSPEFGTNGNFNKCWCKEESGIYLYKRGSDVASNSGLEPYCEVLASQVFSKMKAGIPYQLVNFRNKVASKCKLFNSDKFSFRPYAVFSRSSSLLSICSKYDKADDTQTFRRIVVCDALTLNTDRHLGNHGFLCDSMTEQVIHSAPGFDYNLSMLTYETLDDLADIRECINKHSPIVGNTFIGAARTVLTSEIRSSLINLKGIELELPFYDEMFPEKRVVYMTDVVNTQIENVLGKGEQIYPTFKVDGISNCMKYRLKYKLNQDEWIKDIPRLFGVLGATSMAELEEKIASLL